MSTSDLSTAIILHNAGQLSASAHADAVATHDRLLVLARKGTTIATPEAAAKCADFIRDLSAFIGYVETGRTTAKEPILNEGRAIDALARSLTADIAVERKRINDLLGAYLEGEKVKREEEQQRQWEKEQAAIRKAQEDARKVEDDARATQKVIDDKAATDAAALAAKLATAKTPAAKAKIEAKIEQVQATATVAKAEVQTATATQLDQITDATTATIIEARTAPTALTKLAGVALRQEVFFEVTDIVALYEAQPSAVKMEPNKLVIKSLLAKMPNGQSLPGVTWRRQASANTRG